MEQNANLDYELSRQLEESGEKRPLECLEETNLGKTSVAEGCTKTAQQYADVSTSISLKSTATIGQLETECCGEPSICCEETQCENMCKITITQKVCIKIPISYKIDACINEDGINCNCNQECCE